MFEAPIPGESLTKEPGNAPWEQPPKFNTPNEALAFYFKRMGDEEKMDDLLFVLDQGMPLSSLVEIILSSGVMEGYHTIDVSMLIAPVLHEYLLNLAKVAGIDVVEMDGPTKEERMKAKEKERFLMGLDALLDDETTDTLPSESAAAQAIEADITDHTEPTPALKPQPQGLIPRRQ